MSFWNYKSLLTGLLFIPILYSWKRLYTTYIKEKKAYNEAKLFHERHNCVVMFSRTYIRGWPPKHKIKICTANVDLFLEPFLFFINTAKSSLDIAMMRISITPIFNALIQAATKGVKVRLIVNFLTCREMKNEFKMLLKAGVKVIFYVDKTEQLNYIMHYKYMVKDYSINKGYLCMGSMNFAGISTIVNNYEDVVFSSANVLVECFHANFEECWNMISKDNENVYNKTVLTQYEFL